MSFSVSLHSISPFIDFFSSILYKILNFWSQEADHQKTRSNRERCRDRNENSSTASRYLHDDGKSLNDKTMNRQIGKPDIFTPVVFHFGVDSISSKSIRYSTSWKSYTNGSDVETNSNQSQKRRQMSRRSSFFIFKISNSSWNCNEFDARIFGLGDADHSNGKQR